MLPSAKLRRLSTLCVGQHGAVRVNYLLSASESVHEENAELEALENLHGRHTNATERQIKASEYFVLRNPDFFIDIAEKMRHLVWLASAEDVQPLEPPTAKRILRRPQEAALRSWSRDGPFGWLRRLRDGQRSSREASCQSTVHVAVDVAATRLCIESMATTSAPITAMEVKREMFRKFHRG
jgi:hypothetical protein